MDAGDLDLGKLRAFQLTAQHGSLRWAANRLRLTIPAVSFQIRRLEEEIGVSLFERLPNRLMLTAAGETLAREADGIFEHIEKVMGVLTPKASPSGHLSISTSSDLAWYFSPKISNYLRRHPGIEVSLHIYKSSETLQLIGSSELDVGIGYFPKVPRGMAQESVAESTLTLACAPGHPFLRTRRPQLADIAQHQLLSLPRQSSTRKMIDRMFTERGIATRGVIEAGNCQTAMDFASHGVGIAIIHSLCAGHQRRNELNYIELGPRVGRIEFSVIYRKASRNIPILQPLIEELTSREMG